MAKSYVVAFDMGTTHIKSVMMDEKGVIINVQRGKVKAEFPKDSYVEVDPLNWWAVICTMTQAMIESSGVAPADVKGIIFASAACGVTPVDENIKPLYPSIVWLDNRASAESEMVMGMFGGRDAFVEQTGQLLVGKDALMKQLWIKINEPEIYEKTKYFLDDAGIILYYATGKTVCTHANASTIGYDFENNNWDYNLIAALELDQSKYPPIVYSHEIVGGLTNVAAKQIGLPEGTPVLGGCTDMQAIEIGSGCTQTGDSYFYLGTSGLIGIMCETPEAASPAGVPLVSGRPGASFLMGTSEMAGGCVDWCAETLFKAEYDFLGRKILDHADSHLDNTPPGADNLFFCNWLYGERNPILDEWARSSFINLSVLHTRDHMLRAIYEGVAYQMAWIIDEMENRHDLKMPRLRISGGGTLSKNWMQIMADISGRPADVIADAQMIPAKGAAYIALVGLGIWPGFDAIPEFVNIETTYLPNPATKEIYSKGMDIYKKIYTSLKDLFAVINAPQSNESV